MESVEKCCGKIIDLLKLGWTYCYISVHSGPTAFFPLPAVDQS